jgi:hypothetical protein
MPQRSRKRNPKTARRLAAASAVTLLLTFVVKEVLIENLKGRHASLASAEAQYRYELGQSAISVQILNTRQQIENLRLQMAEARDDPRRDYSSLIQQDTLEGWQVEAELDASLDSVSRLIDRLPPGARDLRNFRAQVHGQVEAADQQVKEMLKPKPQHDVGRFMEVKLVTVMILVQELLVLFLGDQALTRARKVLNTEETLMRLCTTVFYVLGFLTAGLGIYAAVARAKRSAAE